MKNRRFDPRYRSLLHKAVRRGNVELVLTTSARLEDFGPKEKTWFRERTAAITFEECWPLGTDLVFNKHFHSKVAALVKVTRSCKAKDAAGLGLLGDALSRGDQSVLNEASDDKHVKIIASAIRRPNDFWNWIRSQEASDNQKALTQNAIRFKNASTPLDQAFVLAAAYLAVVEGIPDMNPSTAGEISFPYWVALDQDTPQGQRAMRDIARDLHIQLPQLIWTCFYFEGSTTNGTLSSKWWEKACNWRFRKVGVLPEEAHLLWEPAKIQIMEALAEESHHLHNDLYKWKLSNIEQVDVLKKQVELFIDHFDSLQSDQLDLF